MGKYANEQELIIENNLPSRRWKIRRIRSARDRKIRMLDKEYYRVYNQIQDLGYKDLTPPIQRGYKRSFELTEETKYSQRADFYQGILDQINTTWYSPHKTFKEKKRRIGKWKYRQKNEQTIQEPDSWIFHNIKKFTEEEKKYFYRVDYYDYPSKRYRIKYIFIEKWRFVLRVRPNMITKVQIKDSELEQYRDELSDYLDRKENLRRLIKIGRRRGNRHAWTIAMNEEEDRKRYRYNSLTNMPLQQLKEEYEKEKELWEYDQKI